MGVRSESNRKNGLFDFRQVNTNMKLDKILKDDLIFVIFGKEELK